MNSCLKGRSALQINKLRLRRRARSKLRGLKDLNSYRFILDEVVRVNTKMSKSSLMASMTAQLFGELSRPYCKTLVNGECNPIKVVRNRYTMADCWDDISKESE